MRLSTPRVVAVCSAVALEGMSASSINIQAAPIQEEFGLGDALVVAIATAFLIAYGGLLPLSGRLADLRDPRKVFAVGILAFTVGALVCAIAVEPLTIVVGRALQGVGAALTAPAAMVIVTQGRAGAARTRAIAVYGAMGAAGFSLGLVLPGLVVAAVGWRAAFLLPVPLAVGVLLALRGLAAPARRPRERMPIRSAVAVTLALMLLMHALSDGARTPALLAGEIVLAAFLLFWGRKGGGLGTSAVLAAGGLRQACLALGTLYAAVLASLFAVSLALQHSGGLDALTVSLLLLPQPVCFTLFAPLSGRVIALLGMRGTAAAGGVVVVAALTPLVLWPSAVQHSLVVALSMGAVGVSLALAFPAITTWGIDAVGEGDRGTASSLLTACQNVGGSAGLAIVAATGALPSPGATSTLVEAVVLCLGFVLVGTAAVLAVARRTAVASSTRP